MSAENEQPVVAERSKAEVVKQMQDKRLDIRNQIRERDTVQRKWKALAENVQSEDNRRDEFWRRKTVEDTKSIPINVVKFIGSLKKSVRKIMRYKGGTPYSIVRNLFIYWDAAKTGTINSEELMHCMKSLGVKVTISECEEIVQYYRAPKQHNNEMDYHELLLDLQRGEPSIIAFVSQVEDEKRDKQEIRFEEVSDAFSERPEIVKKFLEAVRSYLAKLMRNVGGTPYQHIHDLFAFYDFDFSGGLDFNELINACRKKMRFVITEDQARQIVTYYDRKKIGEICYNAFMKDVCSDVKPILSFTDLSPREIAASKASLKVNPFIPKPFAAPQNKTLENYKRNVKLALITKVNKLGGTVASWIREAFVNYDPFYTGKISDCKQLQGASKRLGVTITEEEARELIHCYDRFNSNEMHYNYLAKEIMEEDPHFLVNGKIVDTSVTATQRTPKPVYRLMNALKKAINVFVKKSKGQLSGRDLLHGTFLRFDGARSGRIGRDALIRLLTEFKIPAQFMDDTSVNETVKWFDTNGSDLLDYNDMTRQMFGTVVGDVLTEPLQLPPLRNSTSNLFGGSSSSSFSSSLKMNRSFDSASSSSALPRHPNATSVGNPLLSSRSSTMAGLGLINSVPESFLRPTYPATSVGSLLVDAKSVTENPYLSTAQIHALRAPTEFTVKAAVMERNLDTILSPSTVKQEQKIRKNKILLEKIKIEKKLQVIEEQRKKLIDDHKARHREERNHNNQS
jgi:Ca2+-binding EF-hand superfamily protein